MDSNAPRKLNKRVILAIVLFLAGSFVVELGFRLQVDSPFGSHAVVRALGWLIVFSSAFAIRKVGAITIVLVPIVWLLASGTSLMFVQPAASVSRALSMPAECRGASDYWDEVEKYGANIDARTQLVMTDSITTQREFDILIGAAEQDIEMIQSIQQPEAATAFHEQLIDLSYGWIGVYQAVWNGEFRNSMLFDLQEVDDELEARQLEFARKCGKYVGASGADPLTDGRHRMAA